MRVVATLTALLAMLAPSGPSPRYAHQMMTYDTDHHRVLMFGGAGPDGSYGDLWAFDVKGWTRLSESGPGDRNSGVFVYDSIRKRAVLYGGRVHDTLVTATWEWDGTTWQQMATEGPTQSVHGAAAFDRVRGVVVLFLPVLTRAPLPRPMPSQTWTWDGQRWTKVDAPAPDDVMPMGMTAEPATGTVHLLAARLGAKDRDPMTTELWEWTGRGWRKDASMPPVVAQALQANVAPAGARGLLLYHAGDPVENRGTWRWDHTAWTHVGTTGPSPRTVHVMAYDSNRDRVVLFGGGVERQRLGDTWEWDGKVWTMSEPAR